MRVTAAAATPGPLPAGAPLPGRSGDREPVGRSECAGPSGALGVRLVRLRLSPRGRCARQGLSAGGDAGRRTRRSPQPLGDGEAALGQEASRPRWAAEVGGPHFRTEPHTCLQLRASPHLPGLVTPLSSPGSWTASMAPSRRSRITAGHGCSGAAPGRRAGGGVGCVALTLQLRNVLQLQGQAWGGEQRT